jgi:hypothetical protein
MGEQEVGKIVKRREILKLAGTAAAFCTSFGFLQGSQIGGAVQDKHRVEDKHLQMRWAQAEIKWYAGATLLHSAAIPAKVAKHLESDAAATVEIKLFRSGQLLKNLGAIQGKH